MGTIWRLFASISWSAIALSASPSVIFAQTLSAQAHIARADEEYAERHASTALEQFRQALLVEPKNYEALWKASRVEVDLAESLGRSAELDTLLLDARQHAESAIAVNGTDAEGHFSLARALGRKALSVGTMERIRFAKVIRGEALEALMLDSSHAGALHVLGVWNAEIMRVNGLARAFAKTFLGAGIFSLASWDEAQRLLERSVAVDPDRIVHHLDLGVIYADRGDKVRAKEQFNWIVEAPAREFNDVRYKKQASERLRKL